ncbi:MAG: hypothetical protein ABSG31_10075 [Tepidisphaeraceae bacterium]
MEPLHPLHYAPREFRPSQWRRWVMRFLVVAAIVAAGVFWGPGIFKWGSLLYWEHRALGDGPTPNSLVADWTRDASNGSSLQKYIVFHTSLAQDHIEELTYGSGNPNANAPNIFAGEMQAPNGERRLVFLDHDPTSVTADEQVLPNDFGMVRCTTIGRTLGPSGIQPQQPVDSVAALPAGSQRLKIFGGQLDATNPSHLTFDFEIDGTRHTADVWLKNDGTMMMAPRP